MIVVGIHVVKIEITFLSGVIFINPCIDTWTRVDTRARAFSVPPQQVLLFRNYNKIVYFHVPVSIHVSCVEFTPLGLLN